MKSIIKIISLILAIILLLPLTACDDTNDAYIYFQLDEVPRTLDPQTAKTNVELMLSQNLYEGLMRFDGDGKLVCAVAESYEKQGLTYTFKLNKKLSNTVYYYDMTGTHVEVGQQMKKLLGPNGELREEGLECQVRIKGSVGDKPYNIEYPTTLGAGTINASGGNNEGYDALSY